MFGRLPSIKKAKGDAIMQIGIRINTAERQKAKNSIMRKNTKATITG